MDFKGSNQSNELQEPRFTNVWLKIVLIKIPLSSTILRLEVILYYLTESSELGRRYPDHISCVVNYELSVNISKLFLSIFISTFIILQLQLSVTKRVWELLVTTTLPKRLDELIWNFQEIFLMCLVVHLIKSFNQHGRYAALRPPALVHNTYF